MVIAVRNEHRTLELLRFLLEHGQKRLERLPKSRVFIEWIAVQRDDNSGNVGSFRRAEGLAHPRSRRLGSPPRRHIVNRRTRRKALHAIRASDQMSGGKDDSLVG